MKLLCIAVLFALVACGRQSSPESRSIIRDEQIQAQINLLKEQNKAMLDSIRIINNELKMLKHR
jgi:hypothetical protein